MIAKTLLALSTLCLALSCGGSTSSDAKGTGGSVAGGAGGSSPSGGAPSGGAGGALGGAGGSLGGAGGSVSADCAGLDYCACKENAACQVLAEACFCPCGVEPCMPDCECACGGGKYLGCAPTSVMNPGALEGLWLVGWSGGMNHFSWVRLEPGGVATFNDGANLDVNGPLWPCSGSGSFGLAAKPETIALYLPPGCGTMAAVTFVKFLGEPSWPNGCLLEASVEMAPPAGGPLTACKFPLSTCDATLSSCQDVLK